MEWPRFIETINCKFEYKLKSEDELMSKLWGNLGIRRLLTVWLQERQTKKKCKSSIKANAFKVAGNKEFQAKNYVQSIDLYTKSALYASEDNDELSVAIANRSASLFYLGRYDDCIRDINFALELEYPTNLRYKLLLRAAECYLKLHKQNSAEATLIELDETLKTSDISIVKKKDIEKRIYDMKSQIMHLGDKAECTLNEDSPRLKPKVAFGENPNFPNASIGIDRVYASDKGKYVVANRFIKRGETLFVEEPLTSVLLDCDTSNTHCDHCCRSYLDVPFPCTTCLDALYCGVQCLKEGYLSYHRWECVGSQIGLWKEVGIAHLALRVLLTCVTTNDLVKFNEVQKLVTNFDKQSTGILMTFGVTAVMLTIYLYEYTDFFKVNNLKECLVSKFSDKAYNIERNISTDGDKQIYISSLVLRYMLQMVANAHVIIKLNNMVGNRSAFMEPEDGIASGIYPSISILNHSCDPNICHIFMDRCLIVKASKDIAEGDEVFNCYGKYLFILGPHYKQMSKEERQNILKHSYCFTCKCKYCTLPELQYFQEKFTAIKCPDCNNALQNVCTNVFFCSNCRSTRSLCNEDKIEEAENMFYAAQTYSDEGEETEALNKLKQCLNIRRDILYAYHDDIVATFYAMAEVHIRMGQWRDAILCLEHNIPAITERYGSFSLVLAHEFGKLTYTCDKYLMSEINKSTEFYKEILRKVPEYQNQMEEILILRYGEWNHISKRMKEHREKLYQDLPHLAI